jgi:hypothetical protein
MQQTTLPAPGPWTALLAYPPDPGMPDTPRPAVKRRKAGRNERSFVCADSESHTVPAIRTKSVSS